MHTSVMHKKSLLVLSVAVLALGFSSSPVFAVNDTAATGVTPQSRWYFFDTLQESMKSFFTLSPEKKAIQQLEFAKERVEEKQTLLDQDSVEDENIEKVDQKLQQNLKKTTEILDKSKQKGKDTTSLSEMLSTKIENLRKQNDETMSRKLNEIENERTEVEEKLREASAQNDQAAVQELTKKLQKVKQKSSTIESEHTEQEDEIEHTAEKIEEHLSPADEATKKVKKIAQFKAEVSAQFKQKNITPPAGAFDKIDALQQEAQAALDAKDYQTAIMLAKKAGQLRSDLEKLLASLLKSAAKEQALQENLQSVQKKYTDKLKSTSKSEVSKLKEVNKKEQSLVKEDLQRALEEKKKAEAKVRELNKQKEAEVKKALEEAREQEKKQKEDEAEKSKSEQKNDKDEDDD